MNDPNIGDQKKLIVNNDKLALRIQQKIYGFITPQQINVFDYRISLATTKEDEEKFRKMEMDYDALKLSEKVD